MMRERRVAEKGGARLRLRLRLRLRRASGQQVETVARCSDNCMVNTVKHCLLEL